MIATTLVLGIFILLGSALFTGKIAEEIVDRKLYESIKDNEIDKDIMKEISDEMFNNWINDTKWANDQENNCNI
jgi:N-acetylneuraminic acid mutarotase